MTDFKEPEDEKDLMYWLNLTIIFFWISFPFYIEVVFETTDEFMFVG